MSDTELLLQCIKKCQSKKDLIKFCEEMDSDFLLGEIKVSDDDWPVINRAIVERNSEIGGVAGPKTAGLKL